MTTIAMDLPRDRTRPSFYVVMAGVFVLVAFGGFTPTYWSKVATGSFKGASIIHIHGVLFCPDGPGRERSNNQAP